MDTEKLYDQDAFLREFDAVVTECYEGKDGSCLVTLDRTAFYPEGGGQPADHGVLGGAAVLDVQERGGRVLHTCDRPLPVGRTVRGVIDWGRRFDHMQQHSGEHIVSGMLCAAFSCDNVGFHMGADTVIIDYNAPMTWEQVLEVEDRANRYIWENHPFRAYYPTPEELAVLPYRSKKAIEGPVRITEFPGADRCACCGTHVAATGEIGLIKLYSSVPFRGGSRIEMACGSQALSYLNQVLLESTKAGHLFSVPAEQVGCAAESFSAQLAAQKYRVVELQRKLFRLTAKEYAGQGSVLHFEPGLDSTGIRELTDCITQQCGGTAAVFSGTDSEGYGYCLANAGEDLRQLGKAMTAALHGRGGGKPGFQQGRVEATEAEIRAFFQKH